MAIVTELTEKDRQAWDAYVRISSHGLPQHLSGWRDVLYKTNRYETHYLLAQEGQQVVGVLPLFLIRSRLFGNTATTMPGGLCAETEAAAALLIAQGQKIARLAKAKRFILHDSHQVWPATNLHTSQHHVHWVVDLSGDAETLWGQLKSNIRRQVRIARRNNLSVEIDRTGRRLGEFYDLFCRFTHQHGTPIFGRNFLERIIEVFLREFNIAIVYKGQQPIGAYFQLQMGKTMYGVWGASLREYLPLRPAYLAHWEILEDACLNGYRYLDMGRSPLDSNAAKYKRQWGGVSKPVYQQVASFGKDHPQQAMTSRVQSDGKLQLIMRLWSRLPLPVAQYLGPKLRHHVPFA